MIMNLVEMHGPKWTLIAQSLATGRSDSSVRNRHNRLMNPSQEESKVRDRASELPWTNADDEKLRVGIARYGFKWRTIIRDLLPERTCHAVRNRFQRHLHKAQQQTNVVANDAASAALAAAVIPPPGQRHANPPNQAANPGHALAAATAAANNAIAAASNAVMHAQQPKPLPHAQAFATPQGMQIMQGPDGRNYQVLPLQQQQQQFMQQQQIMQLQQQQQQQQQQQAIQQQMALQQQQQQMAAGGGGVQQPIANINAPPPGSATVAASLNLIAKDLGGTDLAAVHAYAMRLKEMRRSETPTNEGDGNNNLPTLRLQPPSEMPPVVGPIPGADTSTTYQSQPPPPPQQTLLTRPPTTPTATTNNLPPMHLQPHLQTMPAGTDDHSMMIAAQAAIAQQQAQAQAAQAQAAQLAALQQAAQQQHSQEGAHAMPQLQPGAAQTHSTPTTTTATQQQAIDDLAAKSWAVVPSNFLQMAGIHHHPAQSGGAGASSSTGTGTGEVAGATTQTTGDDSTGGGGAAGGVLKSQNPLSIGGAPGLAAAVSGLEPAEIDQQLVDITDDLSMLGSGGIPKPGSSSLEDVSGIDGAAPQQRKGSPHLAAERLGLSFSNSGGSWGGGKSRDPEKDDEKARSRSWLGGSTSWLPKGFGRAASSSRNS